MPEVLTGFKVEPGHHFEWAWLLNWSGKLLSVDRHRLLGETLLQESWKAGWILLLVACMTKLILGMIVFYWRLRGYGHF